ncbi:MAG TPA: VanZ family protein [Bryobacteraceae bacterium]|nr:VanZ family protein [Bryobacteraceae bacterium]
MKRILLLVVALILYGSLYPWQFHATHLAANPLWILLHSWQIVFDRFLFRDTVVNVALYIPFGAFCFLSMRESRSLFSRSLATVLAAALLSSSIEMAQLFDLTRVCSLFDVFCNTVGAAIGILLATMFPAAITGAVQEAEAAGAFRLSGVIALLYLWAGYELFPFFPALSRTSLGAKLAVFFSSATWPLRDFFESFAGWLAVSALLQCLAGAKRFRTVLSLALLSIPLKLFIVQRTITASEVVGALLAVGCWLAVGKFARPRLIAGLLALAALVAAGLLPFHWSARPQPFTWVPFLPMLLAPWESSFLILLQKSFLYGSAVWLLNESGRGWMLSSLLVAVPLAIVESIQVYLPGRTPELTDPLLALILGFSLMLLERHAKNIGLTLWMAQNQAK